MIHNFLLCNVSHKVCKICQYIMAAMVFLNLFNYVLSWGFVKNLQVLIYRFSLNIYCECLQIEFSRRDIRYLQRFNACHAYYKDLDYKFINKVCKYFLQCSKVKYEIFEIINYFFLKTLGKEIALPWNIS